jgi:hypothetical protein
MKLSTYRAKSSPPLGNNISGDKPLKIKKVDKKAPARGGNGAGKALQALCKCNGGGKASVRIYSLAKPSFSISS